MRSVLFCAMSILFTSYAHATFSIVACNQKTGACGVAVATHNLAVGHGVPFAVANVGAGVSQFETNACHAPSILKILKAGGDANTAISQALKDEANCPDGMDNDFRQIGVVSIDGTATSHTGAEANGYADHRADGSVSVQGNGLASKAVLDAMWDTFQLTEGALAERLLTALEAGYAEGGQSIGVMSAALLVSTPEGWPVDTDLRVDFEPGVAISKLRESYNANVARQLLFRGNRASGDGDVEGGIKLVCEALELAPNWDRIWLNAYYFALQYEDRLTAQERACHFQKLNPTWASMLSGEIDFNKCD